MANEPEFGSVVLDHEGFAHQHRAAGWKSVDGGEPVTWAELVADYGPLIYMAPAAPAPL